MRETLKTPLPSAASEAPPRSETQRIVVGKGRGRLGALNRVAREVVAGGMAAALIALGDVLSAAFLTANGLAGPTSSKLLAALEIAVMLLPFGVAGGAALGLGFVLFGEHPAVRTAFDHFATPRRLVKAAPHVFAGTLSLLSTTLVLFAAQYVTFLYFATRFHRPQISGMAAAAVSLVLLFMWALLTRGLYRLCCRVAPRLGRFASPAVALVAVLLGLCAAVAGLSAAGLVNLGAALTVVGGLSKRRALVWAVVPVVWLASLWLARRMPIRSWTIPAAVGVVGAVLGIALLANFYAPQTSVRTIVEQRSVVGRLAHRAYSNASDWDRDGHAWSFGGGDCDDWNPRVFPGAIDTRGDGVDADCLLGDGTPEVEDFDDGAYGRVPAGLHRPNILLVTIDALRPDHLGVFGYARPTSPKIDAFARKSVRFRHAVAPSSRSVRSIPAMFTGYYPSQLAYGPEFLYPAFLDQNQTIAESLQEAGYATRAVMGTHYFERVRSFFQGFDEAEELDAWRARPEVTVRRALQALRELNAGDSPWFLWVHVMNVHAPYLEGGPPSIFGPSEMDAYDTEITLADREFGRLLDGLEESGVADKTLVVLASDHGEAFGEHGHRYHSGSVYEEEIASTLIVRGPGLEPKLVRESVSLIDLTPTLLNVAAIPVDKPMPARSLLPFMTGESEPPQDRFIFSEVLPDGHFPMDNKMILQGREKLIWWVRENRHQFFDLSEDPGETRDLSDERTERAWELRGLIQAWTSQTARADNLSQRVIEENLLLEFPQKMTRRLSATYGGIFRVVGYDLKSRVVSPNGRIELTLYYEVLRETRRSFRFEIDIESTAKLPPHFHGYHYPLNGHYLPEQWKVGDKLRDEVPIVVPNNITAPSTLRLVLRIRDGLVFLPEDRSERESLPLTTVRVVPAP